MFSKIKSLFKNENNPQATPHEFKHPQTHGADISQCPFMSKHQNAAKSNKQKIESESDSQPEEKPRGGCPFMASSGSKKNPNLGIEHEGYDEPFVSKFKYYLSANKINFDLMKKGKQQSPIVRHIFDQYPIYLKHTLFYNGEDYKKVRSFECCSRFLAYEQLRQKGNKNYNKGRYLKALDYYERAMSLFRWLDLKQEEVNTPGSTQLMIEDMNSQSEINDEEIKSKIHITLDDENGGLMKQEANPEFDEFREKYKEFFIVYHDDNVACFDGEEMTEKVDIDMRRSLLIQLYLNMAAAYIQLNHHFVANQILEDAAKLSDKVSQIYLRQAQVALSNKSSSLQELKRAQQKINKAVQMQPQEKIFQNTNPNILKMCNIHDAKEVYADVAQKLKVRIQQQEKRGNEMTESIENRLSQINDIEKQIINSGKTPKESSDPHLLSQGKDYKILKRIHDKYVRIMEFYVESKDKNQVELAKKQFQQILKILSEIKFIESIEIDLNNPNYGTDERKVYNRVRNIKRHKCEQIYNNANYNFQVLEWAIKEIVKEEHEEREKLRKEEEQAKKLAKSQENVDVKQKSNWMNKLPYAIVVFPIVGIIINFVI